MIQPRLAEAGAPICVPSRYERAPLAGQMVVPDASNKAADDEQILCDYVVKSGNRCNGVEAANPMNIINNWFIRDSERLFTNRTWY